MEVKCCSLNIVILVCVYIYIYKKKYIYIYIKPLLAKLLKLFSNCFNNTVYHVTSITSQRCEICREQFEQYWDEEEEEWHLKNAIRMHEKVIQSCYMWHSFILKSKTKT